MLHVLPYHTYTYPGCTYHHGYAYDCSAYCGYYAHAGPTYYAQVMAVLTIAPLTVANFTMALLTMPR